MSKTNLVISHSREDISPQDAVSIQRDVEEGYTFPISDLSFTSNEYEAFKKELNANYKDIEVFDFSRNKNTVFTKTVCSDFVMYTHGNSMDVFTSIYTKSDSICSDVWNIYIKHSVIENKIDMFFHSYFMTGPHLDENMKQIKVEELNYISEDYYPYINTNIMFDQFFTGAENILLLVGQPGLGKSKMSTLALKHAFSNPDILPYDKKKDNPTLENQFISVAYVKSTDVLVNDNFWRSLESSAIDFCIIDDLDYMLTKRDAEVNSVDDKDKNVFLNQFLSFTDGVEQHKTKFIITTNQSYEDIDTALLRKGRLFDIIEFRELKRDEALVIWKSNNLREDDFNELFGEKVLPAELGSEINKRLNDRIQTATESYLREEGISKIEKASRSKKIGV